MLIILIINIAVAFVYLKGLSSKCTVKEVNLCCLDRFNRFIVKMGLDSSLSIAPNMEMNKMK